MTNFCDLNAFCKLDVLKNLNIVHTLIYQQQQQLIFHELSSHCGRLELSSPFSEN